MKKRFAWLGVAAMPALALFALVACSGSSSSSGSKESSSAAGEQAKAGETQKVICENGVMLGQSVDGVTSFKGVPYAKPSVGELRWKAPQAPDPSNKEIECYDFGYTALQAEWPTQKASYYPKSEDCLTLNIWENGKLADSKEPKPVMVFIHGGAIMEAAGAKNMKDLLAISEDEWLKINKENRLGDENCYVVADGDVIPEDLGQAFKDAAASGMQLIVGSNEDE